MRDFKSFNFLHPARGGNISPMLRPDEKAIAEMLVQALREGNVDPLGAYPSASYTEGADPPDLIIDLGDGTSVGVELGRVLGGNYPEQMTMARKGKLRCGSWSPTPEDDIERVFRKKSASYDGRGIVVDWILFHNSFGHAAGYYDLGPWGHCSIRQSQQRLFSSGPFSRVLLQSERQGSIHWSVLWSDDGVMVETPCARMQRIWRERFVDDDRVATDGVRVERIASEARDIFPQPGFGLVVLLEQNGSLHDLAAAQGAPRAAAARLTAEVSPPYWGWIPVRSQVGEASLAAEQWDKHLKNKPTWWHDARRDDEKR